MVCATYLLDSSDQYIQWDSHKCLVDYKHLHSDTLHYSCKLLKRTTFRQFTLNTEIEAIATYVFGSGHQCTLWDSCICLVDYKPLYSDTLGYKLLKGTRNWHLKTAHYNITNYYAVHKIELIHTRLAAVASIPCVEQLHLFGPLQTPTFWHTAWFTNC